MFEPMHFIVVPCLVLPSIAMRAVDMDERKHRQLTTYMMCMYGCVCKVTLTNKHTHTHTHTHIHTSSGQQEEILPIVKMSISQNRSCSEAHSSRWRDMGKVVRGTEEELAQSLMTCIAKGRRMSQKCQETSIAPLLNFFCMFASS